MFKDFAPNIISASYEIRTHDLSLTRRTHCHCANEAGRSNFFTVNLFITFIAISIMGRQNINIFKTFITFSIRIY